MRQRRFRQLGLESLEHRYCLDGTGYMPPPMSPPPPPGGGTPMTPSGFVSIQSVAAGEGAAGTTTTMKFPVQYNGMQYPGGFSVDYKTVDTTATGSTQSTIPPDCDYSGASGTLYFSGAPGETKFIDVIINGDDLVEMTEYFRVELSNVSKPNIGVSEAAGGTIGNDDSAVVNMSLADTTPDESLNEDDFHRGGQGAWAYKLVLSSRVDVPVVVYYQIMPMGIEAADITSPLTEQHQTVSGPFGATVVTVISMDTLVEPDESFQWRITRIEAQGRQVTPGSNPPANTIENDDQLKLVITDMAQSEGTNPIGSDNNFVVSIMAMNNVEGGVTVTFRTQDYTAGVAEGDYLFKEDVHTFSETGAYQSFQMTVKVKTDDAREANEKFMIVASNPQGNFPISLVIGGGYGWGIITITNDDQGIYTNTGGGKIAFYNSNAWSLGAAFKWCAENEYPGRAFDVADPAAMNAALTAWVAVHGRVDEIAIFEHGSEVAQDIGGIDITGPSTQAWAPLSNDGLHIRFLGCEVGKRISDGDRPDGAAYCDWVCDDAAPSATVTASTENVAYWWTAPNNGYTYTGTWIDFDGFEKKARTN